MTALLHLCAVFLLLGWVSLPVRAAELRFGAAARIDCPLAAELTRVVPLADGGVLVACVHTDARNPAKTRSFQLAIERRSADLCVRWTVSVPLALRPELTLTSRGDGHVPWYDLLLTDGRARLLRHDGFAFLAQELDLDSGALGEALEFAPLGMPYLLSALPQGLPDHQPSLAVWRLPWARSPSGAWIATAAWERSGALKVVLIDPVDLHTTTVPVLALKGRAGDLIVSDDGDVDLVLARPDATELELVRVPRSGVATVSRLDPGASLSGAPALVRSGPHLWMFAEFVNWRDRAEDLLVAQLGADMEEPRVLLPWSDLMGVKADLGGHDQLVIVAAPDGGAVVGVQGLRVKVRNVNGITTETLYRGPIALVELDAAGGVRGRQTMRGTELKAGIWLLHQQWTRQDASKLQVLWSDDRRLYAQTLNLHDGQLLEVVSGDLPMDRIRHGVVQAMFPTGEGRWLLLAVGNRAPGGAWTWRGQPCLIEVEG